MRWLLAVIVVAAACKGDPQKCDQACRNYAELVFWQKANVEIEKLPPNDRDAMRKQKMAELAKNLAEGVDMCTSKCMSANNDKQANCLIKAKTADQAKACVAN
jgi:hypothetical protein